MTIIASKYVRLLLVAATIILVGGAAVSARCIVTVGIEEEVVLDLLTQAHRQKLFPRDDWDPDNSLFGDDGPFDGIRVESFPVSNSAAVECQTFQVRLIEEIEKAIAQKAIAMGAAGRLDSGELIREILGEYGSFEKDAPPPSHKIIVGAGIYCTFPTVSVVDLTPFVFDVVAKLEEDLPVQIAQTEVGDRLACG